MNHGEIIDTFRRAMRSAGIVTDAGLVADGKLHRITADGDKRGRKDAWYVLHADGVPAGVFGSWHLGLEQRWSATPEERWTPEERAEHAKRIELARTAREAEERKRRREAAKRAAALWDAAEAAPPDHPYLVRKGVQPHGLRVATWTKFRRDAAGRWEEYGIRNVLLVPLHNAAGELVSLEAIFPEKSDDGRDKDFLSGGEKAGASVTLGEIEPDGVALLCEGWATGASLFECTAVPVVVAFDAGNLKHVAGVLRAARPGLRLVVCGDNDHATAGNPGATKAKETAAAVHGVACLPTFEPGDTGTDWNDVHQSRGAEAVREAVAASIDTVRTFPLPTARAAATAPSTAATDAREAVPEAEKVAAPLAQRFRMDEHGLWVTPMERDGKPGRPRFVVDPFDVRAMVRDHNGAGWGLLVELKDPDGRSHRIIIPHANLKGEGADALGMLMDRGCVPRQGTDRFLIEYLRETRPEARARITDRTGWFSSSVFVLPDRAIGDEDEPVIFQTEIPGAHQFRVKGTTEQWREHVGALCAGNTRLVFGVSAALAGSLLYVGSAEGGGFHYRGGSSSGKTTILRVAASLCGPAEYMQRWRATDNGLEGMALAHSDCPLLLDELAQLDPKAAGEVAYMLGNGSGKTRATRTGSLRERSNWRVLFQSAGEVGLSEHMAEAGKKTKAGQEIRLCEIPADAGAGLGCFENLHGRENGAEFAKALDTATRRYHGAVWPAFLEKIIGQHEELPAVIRRLVQRFEETALSVGAEGQARRAAQRFALVAAAGELATSFGLTGWPEGEAVKAARACFTAWLARRGGEGNQEERAALRQVRTFLRQYGESAFADLNRPSVDTDTRAPIRSDRAGYRKQLDGEDAAIEYFVFVETWRERVCKGLDSVFVARLLVDRGYAKAGTEKGCPPYLVRVTLPEGRSRVVHILPHVFEGDDD